MWRKATGSVAQPPNEGASMLRRNVAGSVERTPPPTGGVQERGRVSARSSAGRSTPEGRRPSRSHKGRGVGGSTPGPAKPMSSPSWCPLSSASGGREAVPRDGSFSKGVRKGVRGKAGGETGMAGQPKIASAYVRIADYGGTYGARSRGQRDLTGRVRETASLRLPPFLGAPGGRDRAGGGLAPWKRLCRHRWSRRTTTSWPRGDRVFTLRRRRRPVPPQSRTRGGRPQGCSRWW